MLKQKHWFIGLASVAATALTIATTATAAAPDPDANRIAQGFAIAPVPLNLDGLDRDKVGLGSYLVNALGGCNDCHTAPPFAPGGNPYLGQRKRINRQGYLAGGQRFGPFVSPNLTPDARRRPGGMTFLQFRAAIREGKDPENPNRILQVMPWPVYSSMGGRDLQAIYEYLRAIPSIQR
jgi:hypothetical protein